VQAYSLDLRMRVLADCDRGLSTCVVATKFSVSESWVRRLKQRRRQTGEVTPRPPRPRQSTLRPHLDRLRELVAAHPDATLEELRSQLGVAVSANLPTGPTNAVFPLFFAGYLRRRRLVALPIRTRLI
jgi:transposase